MLKNRLFLIAVFIIIGSSNPVAIKFALNAGWTPFALGMLRMAVIGIFFTFWTMSKGEGLIGPHREAGKYVLFAAFCKAVGVVLFYISLSMIPANRAVVISTLSPLVTLVLVHFILESERVKKHHIIGVLTSLAGILILLILKDGSSGAHVKVFSPSLVGDLLMIVSVIFNNAMVVFEKKALLKGASPNQLLVSTNILSVAVFGVLFAVSSESLHAIPVNPSSVTSYLYLVSAVGIFLFYYRRWLVSELDVTYISSFSHLGKAVSIIYAVIFLGESISLYSLLCFTLILAGTVVASSEGRAAKNGGKADPLVTYEAG